MYLKLTIKQQRFYEYIISGNATEAYQGRLMQRKLLISASGELKKPHINLY